MKRISRLSAVLFMAIFAFPSFGETPHSGNNLLLLGNSAAALGRGGTGVAGYGADLFSLNPATAASVERFAVSAQYGTLTGSYYNPEITILNPSSYGVFGASFRMIYLNKTGTDLTRGYLGTIGGGKDITDNFALGLGVNFLLGQESGTNYYMGATLGALYHSNYQARFGNGFGIFSPRFGLSVNAGLPFGSNASGANLNQPTVGINADFFRNDSLHLGLYNDYSMIHGYKKFAAKGGLEAVIRDRLILRVGGSYPQNYEYDDYTAGVGYRIRTENLSLDINYALVHYYKSTFVHYVGVTAEFGELDRTPPATVVKSNEAYISPNHDGKQDFVLIGLDVKDRSKIKGWQLQILDSHGAVVREYRQPNREMDRPVSAGDIFRRITARKESAIVPENIMWDGVDSSGKMIPDGKYSYSFMSWDEHDNYSEKKNGDIIVDNTPPSTELKAEDTLFSPNGDRKKDELVIGQKVVSSPDDEWEAAFVDAAGKSVRHYQWKGSAVLPTLKWDGTDDAGNELPEGLYRYFITAKDRAGNTVRRDLPEITLTRKFETVDIGVNKEYFSLNTGSTIAFKPMVSSRDGLTSWQIIIEEPDGTLVKTLKGEGELPDRLEWGVTDEKDRSLTDGHYLYSLKVSYRSGNEPASFKKKFIVDSTPPKAKMSFTPDLFSPDNDGVDDVLDIKPEASDKYGIASWNITITNPAGVLFKSFSGKGDLPKDIMWEGLSDTNELVESATDYSMILTVTDNAGNITQTPKMALPVDVLVVVTERGLKIRISNIEFGFDSAKIIGKGYKILDRVALILNKYGKYKILIEGHTDDIGDDNYNLILSEKRAEEVKKYLITKGVDRDRLKARGMGETTSFVSNKDNESRRKNRRVEFLLEKLDKSE